jgi:hypothetical protein
LSDPPFLPEFKESLLNLVTNPEKYPGDGFAAGAADKRTRYQRHRRPGQCATHGADGLHDL